MEKLPPIQLDSDTKMSKNIDNCHIKLTEMAIIQITDLHNDI